MRRFGSEKRRTKQQQHRTGLKPPTTKLGQCKRELSSSPPPQLPSFSHDFCEAFRCPSMQSKRDVGNTGSSKQAVLQSTRDCNSSQLSAQPRRSSRIKSDVAETSAGNGFDTNNSTARWKRESKPLAKGIIGGPKRPRTQKDKAAASESLPEVPDHVKDGMDVLLIGSNPGRMSSQKGQHFGHPSNHFYRALHRGGFTPTQVSPAHDYTMLNQVPPYMSLGLTNLASRPTRMAQEVAVSENEMGAAILASLIRRHRPRVGIFVGLGVARAFEKAIATVEERSWVEAKTRVESGSSLMHGPETQKNKNKVEEDESKIGMPCYVDRLDRREAIAIPVEVPTVDDKELGFGVGLMRIAIRHDVTDSGPIRQEEGAGPMVIKTEASEEAADDTRGSTNGQQRRQHQREPAYTLLYACPSTSGRVTTHQLPQKADCMGRARILAEHLRATEDAFAASGADGTSRKHETSHFKSVPLQIL